MKSTALNNILVAIDFSETTPDVIATAIMLNRTHSGKFWVVNADASAPYLSSPKNGKVPDPITVDTQSNDADVVLARIREQLAQAEDYANGAPFHDLCLLSDKSQIVAILSLPGGGFVEK